MELAEDILATGAVAGVAGIRVEAELAAEVQEVVGIRAEVAVVVAELAQVEVAAGAAIID